MDKARVSSIDPDQCAPSGGAISLLWNRPERPLGVGLLLAHGAGAPMDSAFMEAVAEGLAALGVTVVRFEFAYMAARRRDGRRRPPAAQATLLDEWRQVYRHVAQQLPARLAIGGKSMGGRMASLLAAELKPAALVCLGYPFHPAGKPERLRVAHLESLDVPTLIVQGDRDPLGSRAEVEGYALSSAIELHWLIGGDHDFKPLKSTGFTQADHLQRTVETVADFLVRGAGSHA